MRVDIEAWLSGYGADTLTPEEERRLALAALEDQEVFDALAEEQVLRELLSQPAARRELLAALARPTLSQRMQRWGLETRPTLVMASLAVTVAAVLWLWPRVEPSRPAGSGPGPQASPPAPATVEMPGVSTVSRARERRAVLSQLFGLELRQRFDVELRLNRAGALPSYGIGEPLRMVLTAARDCNVLIAERRSDGTFVQLFPNPAQPFPRVRAGAPYSVPPAGEPGVSVVGPAGRTSVRLVAFPVGTDVDSLSLAQLELVASALTVVEASYAVVGR